MIARNVKVLVGVVVALAWLSAAEAFASADPGHDPTAAFADARALDDAAPVATGTANEFVVHGPHGETTRVPRGARHVVATTDASGSEVRIGLPAQSMSSGQSPGSGAVSSYRGRHGALAVEATLRGTVKALVSIESNEAPHTYDFPVAVDGQPAVLSENSDGVVEVFRSDGGAAVGVVAPPWAVDAAGAPVPTHFVIIGSVLRQVVDFGSGTAFPVVADPEYGWGYTNVTAYLNRGETYDLAFSSAASTALMALICAATGIETAGIGCVYGIVEGAGLSVAAAASWSSGNCVKLRIYYFGLIVPRNQNYGARGCY
jgi:hypothetical protein